MDNLFTYLQKHLHPTDVHKLSQNHFSVSFFSLFYGYFTFHTLLTRKEENGVGRRSGSRGTIHRSELSIRTSTCRDRLTQVVCSRLVVCPSTTGSW